MNFTVGFSAVDACVHTFTPIYDIQGCGATAAITGNVTTAGRRRRRLRGRAPPASGFYIQDADRRRRPGDVRRHLRLHRAATRTRSAPASSSASPASPASGSARRRSTARTTTRRSRPANIVHCGTGSVAPTDVTMPFASTTFPERYEGMLVRFPQSLVIAEYFNYDRFGEIVLAQPLAGEDAAVHAAPRSTSRARRRTPGPPRTPSGRITLDDDVSRPEPAGPAPPERPAVLARRTASAAATPSRTRSASSASTSASTGSTRPAPADYTAVNPRPAAPGARRRHAPRRGDEHAQLLPHARRDHDDGADPRRQRLRRQRQPRMPRRGRRPAGRVRPGSATSCSQALAGLDADVIGLNELENTPGVEPLLDPTSGIVAGLNAMLGVGHVRRDRHRRRSAPTRSASA